MKFCYRLLSHLSLTAAVVACSGSSTGGSGVGRDGGSGTGGASTGGSSAGGASAGGASATGGSGGSGSGVGGSTGGVGGSTGGAGGSTGGVGGSTGGVGGSTGGTGGTFADAGRGDAVHCAGGGTNTFPLFNGSCLRDQDCVIVHRQTNCCGSQSTLAINDGEASAFAAAEAICESQYPACGCAAQGPPAATAQCVAGRCTAVWATGSTFACGADTCSTRQYCYKSVPGNGGATSTSCGTDPNCAADCIYCNTPSGCVCGTVDIQGHVFVQCNGI